MAEANSPAEESRTVSVVTEQEIASGRFNIQPVFINLYNVGFTVHYRAGNSGDTGGGGYLHADKTGIVVTGGFFLLHYG